MKLLVEWNPGMEVLTEQTETGKVLYLHGPMIMTEQKNRNGRIYPKGLMEKAVADYQRDYIDERRAIGEVTHPTYPFPNIKEAALMIESLEWHGNDVIGKARVLNNPFGQQIKSLVEANFKMGTSTRGLGDVKRQANATMVTKYGLNAIDAVDMPSGQTCYVNALTEATEWINESGIWVEKVNQDKAMILFQEKFGQLLEDIKKSKK